MQPLCGSAEIKGDAARGMASCRRCAAVTTRPDPVIAVSPPEALKQRSRLFDSIGRLAGVRFSPYAAADLESAVGLIAWDTDHDPVCAACVPVLRIVDPDDFAPLGSDGRTIPGASVHLASNSFLARPLRGRSLEDSDAASTAGLAPSSHQEILAKMSDGRVVWARTPTATGIVESLALDIPEIPLEGNLRSRLQPGRFLGALVLGHFARACAQRTSSTWSLPQTRACIIIDDPNLRGLRYGYLDLPRMVSDAEQRGYHVTCATVPLDARCADARVAELFRRNPGVISLMVHGNNHLSRELAGLRDQDQADAQLAQAYRRVERLETSAGVTVGRLVAPPHGVCSEEAARAMLRCGFEAATINRPFPWRRQPAGDRPLAGCLPADLVAGGLPIISRLPFAAGMDDLILRAWLGMPLVLYGHHADGRHDFRRFHQACELVEDLGGARWMSIRDIARSNVSSRAVGSELEVRVWSRLAVVDVPEDISTLRCLALPEGEYGEAIQVVASDGSTFVLHPEEACPVQALDRLRLTRLPVRRIDPFATPSPAPNRWAFPRRLLVESRDRSLGTLARIGAR
jgi:hypothetical protein